MSAPYYTRGLLRLAHSLRVRILLNIRSNSSSNNPESEPIVEICVMAVVRRVDFVICSKQWASSRVADCTYSHVKFHSGQLITHGWISVGLSTAATALPQPQKGYGASHFLYNAHFIVINFQRQLV